MNCLKVFGDAIDLDSFFCNCRFPFEKRFTTSWPPSLFEIYSLASGITLPTVSPILSKYHENPAFPNLHRIDRSRLHLASGQTNVILIMTDDQGYGDLQCHEIRF